jgi:hypothetical protein
VKNPPQRHRGRREKKEARTEKEENPTADYTDLRIVPKAREHL